MMKKDEEKKRKEEKDKIKQQQKEEKNSFILNNKHRKTQKAKQAEKNPFSVFAEKDGEEVMDDDFVVFTEPSPSDHLPKGTLSRLPLT